jgi:hypothetical protein
VFLPHQITVAVSADDNKKRKMKKKKTCSFLLLHHFFFLSHIHLRLLPLPFHQPARGTSLSSRPTQATAQPGTFVSTATCTPNGGGSGGGSCSDFGVYADTCVDNPRIDIRV